MKKILVLILSLIGLTTTVSANKPPANKNNGMIVRISEIEVYPEYLNEYLIFAQEVAENSAEKEKGVIFLKGNN